MDSIKKKTAISGIKKVTALLWYFDILTERIISVISQDRLRSGTNTNRNIRTVNPESIRLNPKSRSNLAPTKRINGNWVNKMAITLKIFSFSSYGLNSMVPKHTRCCLLYRITFPAKLRVVKISSYHCVLR
jgi:hypothetical protein